MKALSLILTLLLLSQNSFAACDYANDIKKIDATHYSYTLDCHLEMGANIQKLALMTQEELDLNAALTAEKAALTIADQRTILWQDSSTKSIETLSKIEKTEGSTKTLYFILGALTVIAATWATHQLYQK